jgi:uncharacterized protein (DUF2384 family)
MHHPSTISPTLLTKALLRAAEQLSWSAELALMLQISPEEVARLQSGARLLDPEKPEWSSAQKIVAAFRTIVALLGTMERAKAWLGTPNQTFGARPIDVLCTPDAEQVYRYLNAVQKNELRMPPAWKREH